LTIQVRLWVSCTQLPCVRYTPHQEHEKAKIGPKA
jgi:hypothetical protein